MEHDARADADVAHARLRAAVSKAARQGFVPRRGVPYFLPPFPNIPRRC